MKKTNFDSSEKKEPFIPSSEWIKTFFDFIKMPLKHQVAFIVLATSFLFLAILFFSVTKNIIPSGEKPAVSQKDTPTKENPTHYSRNKPLAVAWHPPTTNIDIKEIERRSRSLEDTIGDTKSGYIDYKKEAKANLDFLFLIGILGYACEGCSKKQLKEFTLNVLYELQFKMRIYKDRGCLGSVTLRELRKMIYRRIENNRQVQHRAKRENMPT